ncbi:MAG: type II toxin-antitoxin system VapC family toxin [Acidimicrobiales bacterium]
MVWYLDTSAFLKLVVSEPESSALRAWLADHGPTWSSQLLRTEALRAATRLEIDDEAVETALEAVSLVLPAASTFHTAGTLPPPTLRSLDALHLATALELGEDLEGLVTYDGRVAHAAEAASVTVVSPTAVTAD